MLRHTRVSLLFCVYAVNLSTTSSTSSCPTVSSLSSRPSRSCYSPAARNVLDSVGIPRGAYYLLTTNSHLFAVPSCPKSSFASRAFCVSSPNNWNSLPLHVRSSDSLATFQSRLKSHLFASADHVYSHSHASTSDSTFDYWRYRPINILTMTLILGTW